MWRYSKEFSLNRSVLSFKQVNQKRQKNKERMVWEQVYQQAYANVPSSSVRSSNSPSTLPSNSPTLLDFLRATYVLFSPMMKSGQAGQLWIGLRTTEIPQFEHAYLLSHLRYSHYILYIQCLAKVFRRLGFHHILFFSVILWDIKNMYF